LTIPKACWKDFPVFLDSKCNNSPANLNGNVVEIPKDGEGLLEVDKSPEFRVIVFNIEVSLV
jgi:hypothetical protein